MHNFADALINACKHPHTPLCVGLDPSPDRLPEELGKDIPTAINTFCHELIDALAGVVPVLKPQSAYFEAAGPAGAEILSKTLLYARKRGYLTITDVKRADIGSTSAAYAAAYLGENAPYPSDAITVNPYLGSDGVMPFVELAGNRGAGIFVLVKTSNPSSGELQDVSIGEIPVYLGVAKLVDKWGTGLVGEHGFSSVGAVVGATYPEVLDQCRLYMPKALFLLPGVGAQGARLKDLRRAFDAQGRGGLIVSAREIIYAYQRKDLSRSYSGAQFAEAAMEAATRLHNEIGEMLSSC